MLAHTCTHGKKIANGIIIVGQREGREKVFQVHLAYSFLLENFSAHYVVLVCAHAFVRVQSDRMCLCVNDAPRCELLRFFPIHIPKVFIPLKCFFKQYFHC